MRVDIARAFVLSFHDDTPPPFNEGDVGYLSNLCHNCGACYHACQYAPPHEFGVNVPQALLQPAMTVMGLCLAWSIGWLISPKWPLCYAWYFRWPRADCRSDAGNDCTLTILGCTLVRGILQDHATYGDGNYSDRDFSICHCGFCDGGEALLASHGCKMGRNADLVDAVKASASMRHLGGDSASDVISAPVVPMGMISQVICGVFIIN